jgi:hypothetical protein
MQGDSHIKTMDCRIYREYKNPGSSTENQTYLGIFFPYKMEYCAKKPEGIEI